MKNKGMVLHWERKVIEGRGIYILSHNLTLWKTFPMILHSTDSQVNKSAQTWTRELPLPLRQTC